MLAVDPEHSSPIPFGPAAAAWALAWVVGSGLLAAAVVVAVGGDLGDLTIPELALSALVGWAVFVAVLVVLSRREGSGRFAVDYGLAFRPIDLIGLPLGALTQVALIPALYWPLRQVWPETFRTEVLEERAQDLADRADGATTVLLVVVVVVGAPVVEELVYRGLLQRSLANLLTPLPALGFAALWFGLIHVQWVELPGLVLAGLVFGACVVATGRIGMSVLTHAAFNAVGIGVVLAHA